MHMNDVLKTVQINNYDAERWGIKLSAQIKFHKEHETMLPTKEEAMKLLEEGYARNPGQWKDYSIVVI